MFSANNNKDEDHQKNALAFHKPFFSWKTHNKH